MKCVFFIDIDRTLVFEGTLPERNIAAIARARAQGHYVFINTGRSRAVVQPMVEEKIEFDGFVTALGSYITVGDKVIYDSRMSEESLREVYPTVMKYCPLFGGITYRGAAPGRWADVKIDVEVNSAEDILGVPLHKISMLGNASPEDVQILSKDFEIYQHDTYFEVCPKGNSKATGIKRVTDYLSEAGFVTVAIGDSLNDVPMFEAADYTAVMGDAEESIKQMADYVTVDAISGGVGDAIEYFCSREDI